MSIRFFKLSIFLFSLFFLFLFSNLYAEIYPGAGTTGLSFLKIGVGARSSAMGEACVASTNDISSIYWNPAGLSKIKGKELMFTRIGWFQDVNYNFFATAVGFDQNALAFGLSSLSYGDLEARETNSPQPLYTFSAQDFGIYCAYSRILTTEIQAGITGKILYEKIDSDEAGGYAFDIGFIYATPIENLHAGINFQNIGPQMKFLNKPFKLPFNTKVGVAYYIPNFIGGKTIITGDFNKYIDSSLKFQAGCEYSLKEVLSFRFGYKLGYETSSITTGVGTNIRNFKIDYAFVPYYEDLGNTHRISLGMRF